ncbi:pentatricopeptide repeat-containing protein At2g29760, chloroplastic-like isoform X2 [Gossypium arboreum]|uniref:pentatricopeptide repeat-containing protein At2g29760, chloroplastic-like isoform X2 n=1 Tax=Gossypium arboreum TaxID=29729 RepID=UPI0022F15BB5|nr:pentatricopeptide repeat-containing protein At2g29760, chloroplastic-like isoform X2 [Gossypium arboreum]
MECSMRKQAKCCNRGQFGSSLWGVFKDSFSYLEWEPMFWCSLHSLICIVRWVNIKELDQFSFFNIMPAKNLVSWNVIISGLLQGCAQLADLETGKVLHGYTFRKGLIMNLILCTSIVDLYSKCGALKEANFVFDRMKNWNVITWIAMLVGLIQNRHAEDGIRLIQLWLV